MNNPLSAQDQAIDHQLAQLAMSYRFILDLTPVDANEARKDFLDGDSKEPEFTYRELESDPEVLRAQLDAIDVDGVEDDTVRSLLRNKRREMELQLDMLCARCSDDFLELSKQLYGEIPEELIHVAETILARVAPGDVHHDRLDAEEFLELARADIDYYRGLEPDIDIHADIRPDSSGVMVVDNQLLIGPESGVARVRANALVQHEVGTHLVTQVNGSHQPLRILGTGLAGYDETQEGLGVLSEIGVGELTASRLRQLAGRVTAVVGLIDGASFRDNFDALVEHGFTPNSAFTTTMRVHRSGGLTKDAIYLRGLLELLAFIDKGGELDAFFLGKFAMNDLDHIEELLARGILQSPVLIPRWYDDPIERARIEEAAHDTDITHLIQGAAE